MWKIPPFKLWLQLNNSDERDKNNAYSVSSFHISKWLAVIHLIQTVISHCFPTRYKWKQVILINLHFIHIINSMLQSVSKSVRVQFIAAGHLLVLQFRFQFSHMCLAILPAVFPRTLWSHCLRQFDHAEAQWCFSNLTWILKSTLPFLVPKRKAWLFPLLTD